MAGRLVLGYRDPLDDQYRKWLMNPPERVRSVLAGEMTLEELATGKQPTRKALPEKKPSKKPLVGKATKTKSGAKAKAHAGRATKKIPPPAHCRTCRKEVEEQADTCAGCEKPLCARCWKAARECGGCQHHPRFCAPCEKKLFRLECPRCQHLHHSECGALRKCSAKGCDVFACEVCSTGYMEFTLCRSCESASMCTSCGNRTLDADNNDGACERCDRIGPAIAAMEFWAKTRRFAPGTIEEAVDLLGTEVAEATEARGELADRIEKSGAKKTARECLRAAVETKSRRAEVEQHLHLLVPAVSRDLKRRMRLAAAPVSHLAS